MKDGGGGVVTLTQRWKRIAFPVCAVLLVFLQIAVVLPGIGLTKLLAGEAHALTVALNLWHGLGYTSDGYFNGGNPALFDPSVSVGPVALLPISAMLMTGIDTVVGARLVVTIFYLALLAGLWALGHRIAGRWGDLVAVTTPLALAGVLLSPSGVGSIDALGAIPASAFIAWAAYFLNRQPWLAGLFTGFAVLSDALACFAVLTLGAAILIMSGGAKFSRQILRLLIFLLCAIVPSVAFQIVVLGNLGVSGWVERWSVVATTWFLGGDPRVILWVACPFGAMFLVRGLRALRLRRIQARQILVPLVSSVFVITLVVQSSTLLLYLWSPPQESLSDQRVVAAGVAATGYHEIIGDWNSGIAISVLAGVHLRPIEDMTEKPAVLFGGPARKRGELAAVLRQAAEPCDQILMRAENYAVCAVWQ